MMSKPIPAAVQSAVFDLPSVYANRMNIIAGNDGMARITFGEMSDADEITWHTAVALTNANLESLYATIGTLLQGTATHDRPSKLS